LEGHSPSLKKFPFPLLKGVAWIGIDIDLRRFEYNTDDLMFYTKGLTIRFKKEGLMKILG